MSVIWHWNSFFFLCTNYRLSIFTLHASANLTNCNLCMLMFSSYVCYSINWIRNWSFIEIKWKNTNGHKEECELFGQLRLVSQGHVYIEALSKFRDVVTDCGHSLSSPMHMDITTKLSFGPKSHTFSTWYSHQDLQSTAICTLEKLDKIYLNALIQAPDKIENTLVEDLTSDWLKASPRKCSLSLSRLKNYICKS